MTRRPAVRSGGRAGPAATQPVVKSPDDFPCAQLGGGALEQGDVYWVRVAVSLHILFTWGREIVGQLQLQRYRQAHCDIGRKREEAGGKGGSEGRRLNVDLLDLILYLQPESLRSARKAHQHMSNSHKHGVYPSLTYFSSNPAGKVSSSSLDLHFNSAVRERLLDCLDVNLLQQTLWDGDRDTY
mmetsp:Transcript_2960/g.9981  ORF Transcript_2960/g.9981 Transcript_2960/m.9981 type:complete len:184 (-) Transcript_2960:1501-2052(-)